MTKEQWMERLGSWFVPEPNTGCWLWTRGQRRGYGSLRLGEEILYAHRVAYVLMRGRIPDGLELDHLCRTPLCVNPDHLEPVTHTDNMQRGIIARKTHCSRGHPLSGDNLMTYSGKTPRKRCCKACHQMHRKLWWERQTDERKAELLARKQQARVNRRNSGVRSL